MSNEETEIAAAGGSPTPTSDKQKKLTKFCCVPQCSNYAEKNKHFHRFPKDPKLRNAWKLALKMGKVITDYDVICQDHFLPRDYIPNANASAVKQFLKKMSIPSQKIPKRSHDGVETSPKKRMKMARQQRAESRACSKRLLADQDRYLDERKKPLSTPTFEKILDCF